MLYCNINFSIAVGVINILIPVYPHLNHLRETANTNEQAYRQSVLCFRELLELYIIVYRSIHRIMALHTPRHSKTGGL